MSSRTRCLTWLIAVPALVCGVCAEARAQGDASESALFRPFGDFRLRLEDDWDSRQGDGSMREDRLRLRFRLRLGLDLNLSERWRARVQLRSGPHDSQQSPHITIHDFDGGSDGPYEANFDYWYVSYRIEDLEVWAGRNQLSYWHQDDLYVFDNVTYPGIGATYSHGLGGGALTWRVNYVALPVGMRRVSGRGLMAQAEYARDLESMGFSFGAGWIATRADPDDPDGDLLLTENGSRDYDVLNLQLQHRSTVLGRPLRLGFDYSHNFRDYSGAPPGSFSEFHRDHVDGWVLEALWGPSGSPGDLQLGYYYSHTEALAAHSSYIQDDWARWGTSTQARLTNMKGSEFRVLFTITPNQNIFARWFFVDAIHLLQPGDVALEDGKRFRIEYNVSL
jgi:hypothetical protein